MTIRTMILIAAVLTHQLHAKVARSDPKGTDNTNGKYQYVVALVKDNRRCTGTLISTNWVLTAAHCLADVTHIQYGDLSIPFNKSESRRKVMRLERPPASKMLEPNLGLIYVNSVPINEFGQVSAVDYKAMVGHVIEYAGFGSTKKDSTRENEGVQRDQVGSLQIKEGVVNLCTQNEKTVFTPYLCVAPKCSDRAQKMLPGEPGSPLFHDGKLAGVHVEATLGFIRSYTPVSPYLSWIQRVLNKEELSYRSNIARTDNIHSEYEYRRFQDLTRYLQGVKDRLASYKDEVMSPLLQENYQNPRRS